MKLSFHEYLDKMRGCWNGKNIGGTLGTPFEGMRGLFDIQYYSQPLDKPLPNDDLDLQLVWLNAVEKYGRNINRELLGEYWLSFIYPDCAEYGAGKNNLRAGLVPPLSGYVGNHYRNSNGSWILTEIWACLCPGHPELAVKYAYEDAIIDHSYEGVYAAVFLAAIESAAFIISDTNALIDIGLSYLPEDSAIHKAVACARACYQSGLTWQQARKKLLQEVPSSFSVLKTDPRDMEPDEPVGPIGFDAPGHMGIIVMAWLYGEGDFDKCISIAASCGVDALIHAMEAYTSIHATPLTDMWAEHAIALIAPNLRKAWARGEDIQARQAMLTGSFYAGVAFCNAGVTAVHAFAYPIGARYHIPHGLANTLMLLPVFRFNMVGNMERFARLAAMLGENTTGLSHEKAAGRCLDALESLARDLQVPRHLADYGVTPDDVPVLAESVLQVTRLLGNNPRSVSLQDAINIYREAL